MDHGHPIAVYVHVPFCVRKCGYCDFNSIVAPTSLVERTVRAMVAEIGRSPWSGRPAKTVYFGGGTPTLLKQEWLAAILRAVFHAHPLVEGGEVSCEANPGTVDETQLRAMRAAGVNRLSMGAQSFDSAMLRRLGRIHSPEDVAAAVTAARAAGFDNLSLDLMYGLPGQSLDGWARDLDAALALKPDHLSLYALTIEEGTPFFDLVEQGRLELPDDDLQAEMADLAAEQCTAAGLPQYEISNYARPGRQCGHNLAYWNGEEYLGYGPGAVGCVDETFAPSVVRARRTVLRNPRAYCDAVEAGGPIWEDEERLDEATVRFERIMLGIRLNEGLSTAGLNLPQKAVAKLIDKGWLEQNGQRLKLTPQGRRFCSDVAVELS